MTWKINANGYQGELLYNVDNEGVLQGSVFDEPIIGFFNGDQMWFIRNPDSPERAQIFRGYYRQEHAGSGVMLHFLTGTFDAFLGTGGTAKKSVFEWTASERWDI